jgi:hypothetical protein
MKYGELLPTYQKVRRVIRSCKTVAQLNASRRYAQLFMKRVPPTHAPVIAKSLTQLLKQQTHILWL